MTKSMRWAAGSAGLILFALFLGACQVAPGSDPESVGLALGATPTPIAGPWSWEATFVEGTPPFPPPQHEIAVLHDDGTGVSFFADHNPHAFDMPSTAVGGIVSWETNGRKVIVKYYRYIFAPVARGTVNDVQVPIGYLHGKATLAMVDKDSMAGTSDIEAVGTVAAVCGEAPVPCQLRYYGCDITAKRMDLFAGLLK